MQDYKELLDTAKKFGEQLKDILPGLLDQLPADKRAEVEAEMQKLKNQGDKLGKKLNKL